MIDYINSVNPFALAFIIFATGVAVSLAIQAVGRTTKYVLEAVREHVREEDRPETALSRVEVDDMIENARREWRDHWLADARVIAKEECATLSGWKPDRTCEACGAGMLRKVNRKTGGAFWGCSSYPRCTNSRSA